jgi:Phosphoesterase family
VHSAVPVAVGTRSEFVGRPHLATDLAGGTLPAFSFITPNLIDDMHDGTIADGDTWLAHHLPAILGSPQYRAGTTSPSCTSRRAGGISS